MWIQVPNVECFIPVLIVNNNRAFIGTFPISSENLRFADVELIAGYPSYQFVLSVLHVCGDSDVAIRISVNRDQRSNLWFRCFVLQSRQHRPTGLNGKPVAPISRPSPR